VIDGWTRFSARRLCRRRTPGDLPEPCNAGEHPQTYPSERHATDADGSRRHRHPTRKENRTWVASLAGYALRASH
jgi:hypothetical protein